MNKNMHTQADADEYWEIQWKIALADDRERRLLARQNVIRGMA